MINMESDAEEVPSTDHLVNGLEIDLITLAEFNNSDDSVMLNYPLTSDNNYEQKFQTIFKNKAYLEHLQYLTESNPPKQDVLDEINKFLKFETLSYEKKLLVEENEVDEKLNIDKCSFVQINIETAEKFPEWSRNLEKTCLESNGILRIAKLETNVLKKDKLSKSINFTYNDFLDLNNSSTPNKLKFGKTNREDLKQKKLTSNERQGNKSNLKELNNITQNLDSGISTISQTDQPKQVQNTGMSNIRKVLFRQNSRSQRHTNKNQEKYYNLKGISELPTNDDESRQSDKENLDGIQSLNNFSQSKPNKESTSQIPHKKYDVNNKYSSSRKAYRQLESSSGTPELSILKDTIVNNNRGDSNIRSKQSIFPIEKRIPYVKLCRILDKDYENLKFAAGVHKLSKGDNNTCHLESVQTGDKNTSKRRNRRVNLPGTEDLKAKNSRAPMNAKKTQSEKKDHPPKTTRGPKRSIEDSELSTSSYHPDLKQKEDEMPKSKNVGNPSDINSSSNKKIIHGLKNIESGEDNKSYLTKEWESLANSTEPGKKLANQVVVKLVDCFENSEASKNTALNQNMLKKTKGRKRIIEENVDNSQQPNLNEKKIDQKSKVRKTEKQGTINSSSTSLNTKCSENVQKLRNREIVSKTKALGTSSKLTETNQSEFKKGNPNKKAGRKNVCNKTADKINHIGSPEQSIKCKKFIKPKNQKLGEPEVAFPISKSFSTSTSDTYTNGKNELAKTSMSLRVTRREISPQKPLSNIRRSLTRPKYRKLFSLETYLQSDECIKRLSSR